MSHFLWLLFLFRGFLSSSISIRREGLMLSWDWLFATPWTVVRQAPLSVGFSRQEYWSGLPFPTPGDLPNPESEPASPALAGRFFTTEPPGKLQFLYFVKSSVLVFSSQQLFSKIIRPPSLQDLIGAFLGPVGEEHLTPSKACFLPCFDAQTLEGSTLIKPLYF